MISYSNSLELKARIFLFLNSAIFIAACASTPRLADPTPPRAETITPFSPVPAATAPRSLTPVAPLAPFATATRSNANGGVTNASAPSLKGQFVYTTDDGTLWIQEAESGKRRALFTPTSDEYAAFPAFSHDGKQITFSVNAFTQDGQPKNDLRIIKADGTNEKIVMTADNPRIALDFPVWSPDDKEIFFTQITATPPSNEHDEIDHVSVAGGAARRLIDNASDAHVSPDGKKISFQRMDAKTFSSSLWVASLDGSSAKRILDSDTFASLFGARFSPDSQTLVFAASGPPNKKLPGVAELPIKPGSDCFLSILFTCLVETASAHGLPWDLWLVNLDGTKFERLTNIGSDSPVPAWSQDGKSIAYYEANGIYVVDREKKKIYPVSDRGGYGGFDWH